MKQFILTLLIVAMTLGASAQKRKINRVERVLEAGDYHSAIYQADKVLRTGPKKAGRLYLYKAIANYRLAMDEPNGEEHYNRIRWSLRYMSYYQASTRLKLVPYRYTPIVDSLEEESTLLWAYFADNGEHQKADGLRTYISIVFGSKLPAAEDFDVTPEEQPEEIEADPPTEIVEDDPVVVETEPEEVEYTSDISTNKVVKFSKSLIGSPYKYGGDDKGGFDCSGFTQYVYKRFGIDLPHSSGAQSALGEKVPFNKAKPGDLVFFGTKSGKKYNVTHVGIYNENNGKFEIIHSVSRGVAIDDQESSSWIYYWQDKVLFVKRIL